MKTIIITIAAVIALTTTTFGKTRNMTINQYNLQINKIDSSVVGTWEKSWNMDQKAKNEFCQFNANGTFISFKKESGKYIVTGRGNWMVEKDIISMVKKLPPGYQQIFMLYVVEGYNHREIAVMLNCSEGTSKSQLYRSKTRLQEILRKTA